MRCFSSLFLLCLVAPVCAEEATPDSSLVSQIESFQLRPEASAARGLQFGLKAGYYAFSSGKSRETFGGDALSISPSFSGAPVDTRDGRFRFDFSIQNFEDGENQLFFVPLTASFRKAIGNGENRPYAGVGLSAAPTYIDVPAEDVRDEFKVALGGTAFVGTRLGRRFSLEARYYLLSQVEGYDLSGAQLTAGVRF